MSQDSAPGAKAPAKKAPARGKSTTKAAAPKPLWEKLSAVDVGQHVDKIEGKEGKFKASYLSWAWAWMYLMQHAPEADFELVDNPDSGIKEGIQIFPDNTVMVHTRMTIDGKTRPMWLPVMDNRHNSVRSPTSRQISDALMRCMVKNMALFGLGHSLYAGEDLPDAHGDDAGQQGYIPQLGMTPPPGQVSPPAHDSRQLYEPRERMQTPSLAVTGSGTDAGSMSPPVGKGDQRLAAPVATIQRQHLPAIDPGEAEAFVDGMIQLTIPMMKTQDQLTDLYSSNTATIEQIKQAQPQLYTALVQKFRDHKHKIEQAELNQDPGQFPEFGEDQPQQ